MKPWNEIVANCLVDVPIKDQAGNITKVVKEVATLRCIPAVFQNLIVAALIFAGVVAIFFIIYAGLKYINSGGDPKQVEGARHTLTYAIIGLLVILLSFFIINVIGEITGATCIKFFGFDTCI